MSKECPFKIGDTVRHRGSGQGAVVVAINNECNKHTVVEHMLPLARGEDLVGECNDEYSGRVTVSTGFHSRHVELEDFLLETVDRKATR